MTDQTTATHPDVAELEELARQARVHIVRSIASAHGGHLGGPLSATDMLIALYFRVLRIKPEQPDWVVVELSSFQPPLSLT